MHIEQFDTLARWAASSISRRRSLAALGSAAVTATVTSPLTAAKRKKRGKKCRKKSKKAIRRTCGRQVGECEAGFLATDAPELVPCCALLDTCDFTAFFGCAG